MSPPPPVPPPTPTAATITTTTLSRSPAVRKTSSPFLRKPVPTVNANGEAVLPSPSPSVGPPVRKLVRSLSSGNSPADGGYRSIDDDYDDDHTAGDAVYNSRSLHKQQTSLSSTITLERHLSLIDLIAVGVGGTIGSGLFVLAGLVSHSYAGPATTVSWLISGLTACLSGCCYAELSSRIPLAGGAYAFNYVASGELSAILSAACLSLEYIAAAAAVSRSWGDKVLVWWREHNVNDNDNNNNDGDAAQADDFTMHSIMNPMAFFISTSTVALLLMGVKESKAATNFFTSLKLFVVGVMVFGSLYFVQPSNWTPFAPYGVGGVIRGATGTFFGYLGYDQVTSLAGEAKNAKKNLPRAIMGVLVFVVIIYMTATLGLTGMQPYEDISPISGFPAAFRAVNARFISEFIAFGEIATLPIVILVTIMAQPRLQYALAVDGLLPPFFGELDDTGNLKNGTLFAGGLMILVATFVPFEKLNDMISCSVLTVLALTDSSVVLLWHEGPPSNPRLSDKLMFGFNIAALATGLAVTRFEDSFFAKVATAVSIVAMIVLCTAVYVWCPRSAVFGGTQRRQHYYHGDELRTEEGYFTTPFVPVLPCLAVAVNWYLIAQLDIVGVAALVAFLCLAVLYYFLHAAHHSVGSSLGWDSPHTAAAAVELKVPANEKNGVDEQTRLTP